jgi:hypothetical protein
MAKQGGMGDNLYVDGFDFSGDIGSLSRIGGGPALLDVTGIDKSGMERLGGIRDGAIEFSSFFNDSVGMGHKVLRLLPTADTNVMYMRGTAIGSPAAFLVGKQVNYDPTRGADGSLTVATSAQANAFGLEWGVQLTAGKRTDTAATSPATGLDTTTVSTAFGLQAMLQVFSFTGTSCTVSIQDSADNSSFAAVTGLTFTAATGRTSERISTATTATIRRYLRVITTGTFSSCVFSVVANRNESAVVF